MSEIKERIIPSGRGMDTDSDILAIGEGKSRYRLNVIEKDGDLGALVNTQGNTQIDFTLPFGTKKVIGGVEDEENGTYIAFLFSDAIMTLRHSIVEWDPSNDTARFILNGEDKTYGVGALLDFQEDKPIDAGIIGNGDDRYLVWTDGYNEPRMINITMAVNYTAGSGTPAYDDITEDVIRFYKKPHLEEFNVYYTGTYDGVNNLRGKSWQFAIRKRYYDNTYSVLGPPSEIPIPQEEESPNGLFTSESKNTGILLEVYRSSDDDIVAEYQLCYRTVDIGSGANSNWYLADMEWLGNPTYFGNTFYNNQTGVVLDEDDAARFYDYVPDLADHLFVIDSNRVVFGGITEGYDNISSDDLDVTLSNDFGLATEDGIVSSLSEDVPLSGKF